MQNNDEKLLDIYKIYVQTAENISEKRAKNNSFYLTLCSTLITASVIISRLAPEGGFNFVISLIGIIVSVAWYLNIDSYKRLNDAKYSVIQELEKALPAKCFTDEWEQLEQKNHKKLSDIEKYVPIAFGFGFFILLIC